MENTRTMFNWFEHLLYLDPASKFQFTETKERPGYFVGYTLTFKFLKNNLVTVLHKGVIRPVADANHWKKRVSFKAYVQ
jgi:hypothetical protein